MRIHIFLLLISILASCAPSGDIENYSEFFENHTEQITDGEFSVTYFGVSTLLFDDGDSKFIIDAFMSRQSASEVLFRKLTSNKKLINKIIEEHDMQDLDAVLTSHSHYDHASDAAYTAAQTSAKLYGSRSTLNLGRGGGVEEHKLHEFVAGSPFQIGEFEITVIKAKHSPTKVLNNDLGEEITKPLYQPARYSKYKEGGSFDFMITRGKTTVYIKASPNFIAGALDSLRADVLFLGTGSIGTQKEQFLENYYGEIVGALKPKLVVPIHWDNFLKGSTKDLVMMPFYMDRGAKTFDYLKERLHQDSIDLKILKGESKIILPFRAL